MKEKHHPSPTLAVPATENAMPMLDQKGGNPGKGAPTKGKTKGTEKPGKAKVHVGCTPLVSAASVQNVDMPTSESQEVLMQKKAVEDHKAKEQKGDKKGDGKGKGKKDKGKAGASATVPSAAAAAAASSVTITEVEVMWKSFVEFAKKALPAMNVFLKLSVPIFASLVSGVMHLEHHAASARIRPAAKEFHDMSIELLGDTGAGMTSDREEP